LEISKQTSKIFERRLIFYMARRHTNRGDMAMDEMSKKHWMMHKRMMGGKMIILGALVFANFFWVFLNWPLFIGGVLVLAGLLKLAMPCCKHCRM
jgi:uncharacterized membrane protein HdeD (DUF308 family)